MTKEDANFNERTDTVNDWMDYNISENMQIESHYQDCLSGKKNFGDKIDVGK